MITSYSQALSAYKSAANSLQDSFKNTPVPDTTNSINPSQSEGTFLSMVKGYLEKSIDSNVKAEELSIKAVRGEADLTEVITAVANAEATLRTIVTIRDRVIRAYEEIIRMPV